MTCQLSLVVMVLRILSSDDFHVFLTLFLFAEGDAMEQSSEDPIPTSAEGSLKFCFLILRHNIFF